MAKSKKSTSPEVDSYGDSEWRAKDDLRTLQQAEEIQEDPKRMKAAMKCAGEQMNDLESIMKRSKGMRG